LAREGARSKVSLFGLRQFLGTFRNLLQFARMPKATGRNSKQNTLQHPATNLWQQDTPLGTSSAGARDSRMAVGTSDHQECVNIMQLERTRLGIVGGSLTKAIGHSMWQCRECGNPNMSQRILMIKIEFILYLLLP